MFFYFKRYEGDEVPEDCDCGPLDECKTCYGPPCSCPGEWEEWGPCDGPCGSGYRTRLKDCLSLIHSRSTTITRFLMKNLFLKNFMGYVNLTSRFQRH